MTLGTKLTNLGSVAWNKIQKTRVEHSVKNCCITEALEGTRITLWKNMDRSSRQKINEETQALNDTIDQIDLIDIYRTFHPKTADYTFFSSAHGTFSRIDHILGHKSSLSKFKKIKITSSIFSDHNAMRLEINYTEKKP